MEFKRGKGKWTDTEKLGYRITKSQIKGLPTRFYACVRVYRECDGEKYWEFAWHRRGYKTLKKAAAACEYHHKIWTAFIALGEATGHRKSRVETLRARGRREGGNVLFAVPVWARPQCDPTLLRMISPYTKRASRDEDDECNDRSAPSETSTNISSDSLNEELTSSSSTPESFPASDATAAEPSTTPKTRRARSKETSSATGSSARVAKGRSSGRKRNTAKSTAKQSNGTKRTRKNTVA